MSGAARIERIRALVMQERDETAPPPRRFRPVEEVLRDEFYFCADRMRGIILRNRLEEEPLALMFLGCVIECAAVCEQTIKRNRRRPT